MKIQMILFNFARKRSYMEISPKYQMKLIKDVETAIWEEFRTYKDVLFYIRKWHESEYSWNSESWENFAIEFKDEERQNIDLSSTLHNMNGETLLKVAIDLGVDTPDFIPSIPTFRNEIKSDYETASATFEKAFRCIESDPDTAIGLVNSALESIIKEILKDERIAVKRSSKDTLYSLAQSICKAFYNSDGDMPIEVKTMTSSLLSLSQSVEKMRSEKTCFHGKTKDDYILDNPLYVYFVVNAVCTVALFLMSFYKAKYKPLSPIEEAEDLDLPF